MGEIWPTTHVTELCLHSLPTRGPDMEMSTTPTDYRVVKEHCEPLDYLYLTE